MAERQADDGSSAPGGAGRALKRRGLIAGAAALVAGIAAQRSAQPVAAGGTDHQALVIAETNTGSGATTLLSWTGPTITSGAAFAVADSGAALETYSAMIAGGATGGKATTGVYGTGYFGVQGRAFGGGTGVIGISNGVRASSGVFGGSDVGQGVWGASTTGDGVYGTSSGSSPAYGNGVYGYVYHAGSTQVTAGVFGDSNASYGVIGRTTAVNYSGCTGIADGVGRAAFAGAGTNGAYGAYFTGPTVVAGDFTVVGGAKNAAVAHPDGTHRLLHCMESPEPWFEDFGEAKLVNGKAEVKLDADFAALVDTAAYHVFVTPHMESGDGLAVVQRRAESFSVVERNKGTTSGSFSYRIVAKRKDLKVGRLARFELPKIKLPKPEEMPPPPVPPKKP